LRDVSIRGGQGQTRSRLGGKVVGLRELPCLAWKTGSDRIPGRLGRKYNGNGRWDGRDLEHGMHVSLDLESLPAKWPAWSNGRRCSFLVRLQSPYAKPFPYYTLSWDHGRLRTLYHPGRAQMAKKSLDGRHRDTTGRIDKKHGNTRVKALRKPTARILPTAGVAT
jgi:hypothetical protein